MMGQKKILEIETRLRTELASVSLELTKLTWYVDIFHAHVMAIQTQWLT